MTTKRFTLAMAPSPLSDGLAVVRAKEGNS